MARKFKKKLARKQTRSKKEQPILSINLIRKEYKERIFSFWNKLISKAKRFRLSN